jgi:NADH-quinone oxidoreductase subunit N
VIAEFIAPTVQWGPLAPVVVVLGAAIAGVLVEAFVPARARRQVQVVLALAALAGSLVAVALLWPSVKRDGGYDVMSGSLVVDGPTLVMQATILVVAVLSVLVMADRTTTGEDAFAPAASSTPGSDFEKLALDRGLQQTEVYPLVLFATGGMLVFGATADLLTLFVALEVLSLPLYLLTGMARRRRLQSQEASMKYFLLGAFASALFIFGIALIYGYAGSLNFSQIAAATATPGGTEGLLLVGSVLVLSGVFFKVGAVPFHMWTPDVYQGAPTPITGFMAAGTKIAAFGAMLRLVYVMLEKMGWDLSVLLWTVAIATMLIGTVAALVQTDMKRLLAYSSIAHAGFVLTGVAALDKQGPPAVAFYLLAYGLATVGAFAIISLVRERSATGGVTAEATALSQWSGLGRSHPLVATTFLLFLLSFAGIPLTAGFVGKFTVFAAAVAGGAWPLAVVGVLASAAAAFVYFKVVVLMFFPATGAPDGSDEPAATLAAAGSGTSTLTATAPVRAGTVTVVRPLGLVTASIAVCAVLTVLLGVLPGPVLDAVGQVAAFLP